MSDDTKEKSDIAREDVVALAKAMFRVQAKKSDDKASFKDARAEMLPLARRTLKALHKQGYGLTKS